MADLSFITSCVKYMLFIFNFLFAITGIIVISVGAVVQGKYSNYGPVLDGSYNSVAALLIAIGVLIFIIAFFGCCGAIKENYCMTLTFSILLILIFVLELSAGISGYVLRNRTESFLQKSLLDSLVKYQVDQPTTQLWDEMQVDFTCCGVKEPADWSKYGNKTLFPNGALPMTCCKQQTGTVGSAMCNLEALTLYKVGCADALIRFVKAHAASLGATGVFIAIIQFVGIIGACHLARRTKYEMA